MKKLFLLFALALCALAQAQTTRYFEFRVACGHGNWQDTSFIVAATNPVLVASVLYELNQPMGQRKIVGGPITHGHGGHNHNASHWFLWHFVPDQWSLADVAIEVCDGCPYTDVDSDTAYWISNLGDFCPWSGQPVREVTEPLSVTEPDPLEAVLLYPNPAKNKVHLNLYGQTVSQVSVYDALGKPVLQVSSSSVTDFDVSTLPAGLYVLHLQNGQQQALKKLWVVR